MLPLQVFALLLCADAEKKLEPVRTSITVTESVQAEAPAAVSVLDNSEIRETPGVNLDDRLRSIPGFSLFRRNSSVIAHPTTQGISLRGIGSSGASRSLVLLDGIPMNDPFGGWVYWTRFSPDEVGRVEVSRGASTSIFGDKAMGGAVAMFSREPERRHLYGRYEGGNRNSHDASAGYSDLWSRFGVSVEGRAFTTDGYYIVPEYRRGRVDTPAGLRFVAANTRIDYLGSRQRFFLKADILAEDRKNGTPLQNNSTSLGMISASYHADLGNQGLSLVAFHTREEFHSSFTAVAANRNTETLSYTQRVPAEGTGGAGLYSLRRSRFNVLAGGDYYRAEGASTDSLVPTGQRIGGGVLPQYGGFVQADATAGPARFYVGVRETHATRDQNFFSPSAGFAAGHGRWRARGSVYRSFRAPTLNELYREFRAGNATTRANPDLRPERLFGAEVGLDFVGESTRARISLYRNDITDLITNVTLSTAANQIIRQRQNAASALGRGVEFDSSRRWRFLRGDLNYLFVDSRFTNGFRVSQIPRHQGSAQLAFEKGNTRAAAGVRSFAMQFEDDINLFRLPGYATVQFTVQQRLTRSLSAIAGFENLLDREYLTGFSPTPTIGAPRLWRIGLRWDGKL